jgi:hypothetical protein
MNSVCEHRREAMATGRKAPTGSRSPRQTIDWATSPPNGLIGYRVSNFRPQKNGVPTQQHRRQPKPEAFASCMRQADMIVEAAN